jgi:hypothetical protein
MTISQRMRVRSPHRYSALLNKCETTKGNGVRPDQVAYLVLVMLFVNCRSDAGRVWEITLWLRIHSS